MAEYYSYSQIKCPYCGKSYSKFFPAMNLCCCTQCLRNGESICFSECEVPSQDLIDKALIYTIYHETESKQYFLGSKEEYEKISKQLKNTTYGNVPFVHISPEQVEAWYPRTFAQKIDYILLYFAVHTKYNGEARSYSLRKFKSIFFVQADQTAKNYSDQVIEQVKYILNYLIREEFVETGLIDNNGRYTLRLFSGWEVSQSIRLTPKALARVDELQKDINNNKNIFVAISFAKEAEQIWNAITEAIEDKDVGFVDIAKKEKIHNQQIMPHIMRLIRESRFLIMDITDPNYGAYYEAGYALGLGKEVIITCRKDVHDRKAFKCDKDETCRFEEKALKPHFDIAQKQILVWENTADLTKQLKEWILELSTRKR